MKLTIFAAALMLGGAAFAQTTTDTGTTAGQTGTTAPDTSGTMGQTGTTGTTGAGMSGQAGMTGGTTVAPDNSNPRRGARGIPVVSDSASAPAGWNSMPQVGGTGASASAPAATQGASGDLPPCTRTVTDHCVQTYERGVAGATRSRARSHRR